MTKGGNGARRREAAPAGKAWFEKLSYREGSARTVQMRFGAFHLALTFDMGERRAASI